MNHMLMDPEQGLGPAVFFDRAELLDESTLAPAIVSDLVRESRYRAGRRVRVVELTFTSQQWQGLVWRHPARIYVPDGYDGDGAAGIIGTERQCFEHGEWARRTIPGTTLDTEGEYAEGTALDLGMPVMIFANPADCPFGLDESDFTGHALKRMLETGDLTWNGYYPIAKAYLRAITLLHSLAGIGTKRAVLLGHSKRGVGVAIASGADPERVAGVMVCGYHGGNNLYHLATKFAEFGPHVAGPSETRAGPGFQGAETALRALNNPVGFRMLMHFDPYLWRDRIQAAYLVALGTNDEFFALGAPNSMMTEMQGDKAYLAIDNVRHSWVSAKHLAAWRMWLARTFAGRRVPGMPVVRHETAGDRLAVVARVESTLASGVSLFHAFHPVSQDWRTATWQSTPMVARDGEWHAALQLRPGYNLAWYVEVEHGGAGGTGYVSSLVQSVRPTGE
ncbi:PhoPQ-activated protein PqaA family protein [Burkholderia anthina]|uniref:PhoPQ-activated protein PqaA family protein n=1 Tax=Burkholderia anthina TaxID=179879 RepID=UPI00158BBC13|nr:PhoPQ-activated protein PqaA family protein [Burkholderia anthina]